MVVATVAAAQPALNVLTVAFWARPRPHVRLTDACGARHQSLAIRGAFAPRPHRLPRRHHRQQRATLLTVPSAIVER